jgi:hypothetical protein
MTNTECAAMIEAARQEGREELAAVTRERDELLRVCTEIAETTGYMHESDSIASQPCEPSELPALMGRLREERDEARSALLAADGRVIEARAEGERIGRETGIAWERAAVLQCAWEWVGEAVSLDEKTFVGAFAEHIRQGDHHPENSDALTRLIAEKQAEALEAFAREVAGVRDVQEHNDFWTEDECRAVVMALETVEDDACRRAAAYRKGGAP